jgi:hypothetical protein
VVEPLLTVQVSYTNDEEALQVRMLSLNPVEYTGEVNS